MSEFFSKPIHITWWASNKIDLNKRLITAELNRIESTLNPSVLQIFCIYLVLDCRICVPGIDTQPCSVVFVIQGLPLEEEAYWWTAQPKTSASGAFLCSHYFLSSFSLSMLPHLFFFPSLFHFFLYNLIFPSFLSLSLSNSFHTLPSSPPSFLVAFPVPSVSGAASCIQKPEEGDGVSPFTPLFCFCISVLTAALRGACSSRRHLWTWQSSRHTGFTLYHSLSGC